MPNRGIYFRNQVTPFVILFIERDGSTFMISLLSEHPEIHTVYERLAVLKNQGAGSQEQLDWVGQFLTPGLVGRDKAIGFKTKLKDILDLEEFANILHEKQIRVIHMQRRNVVKAVVSKINARLLHERTGNWNLYKEADRLPPGQFDLAEFDTLIEERERLDQEMNDYVSGLQVPSINICYEDILADRDKMLRQVFAFLNVKWYPVEGKTKKNTKDDLRQVIDNYDELRRHYAGTRYAPMFEENTTITT